MDPVPILTYHGAFIDGNDYGTNNHAALAHDLATLDALGFTVVPLRWVVDALLGARSLPPKAVAITMDDGTDFDFRDIVHPTCGLQRGMLNILRDFVRDHGPGRQQFLNATTFVIASPVARSEIDRNCLRGEGWYGDAWWSEAQASGLLSIGNHSWDHNHPQVSRPAGYDDAGTFRFVESRARADHEIGQAARYIRQKVPDGSWDLFAYPFGEHNRYLHEEYFGAGEINWHTRAAFTLDPAHVTGGSYRWALPRYMFGTHWSTPEDFRRILAGG